MAHDYGYSQYDCDKDRRLLANIDDWQIFRDLIDDANRANVTFYPVDSRGLAAMDNLIIADLPPNVDQAMLKNRIETLRTLATDTDGIAVVDTNDLEKGLRRVVDDLTSYYLLGYYSTNGKNDGKFRKITVRVKRPGSTSARGAAIARRRRTRSIAVASRRCSRNRTRRPRRCSWR